MAVRAERTRRIPRIGFATLLVILPIGALLSFYHVWSDAGFSHPTQGDPLWTWDSMLMGILMALAVVALGTPVFADDCRTWFVQRDSVRWLERLRWPIAKQEWFAIVLSLCAMAGLFAVAVALKRSAL